MVDGTLIFDTKVDQSGFNRGTKALGASSEKAVGGISNGFRGLGKLMVGAFAVTAMVAFGKQALDVASDLQEVQNVVNTAFGSMAGEANEFAKTAIESFGMSELSAKQTASRFMAMSIGMGLGAESAKDMSLRMTGLTGDMASFFNVTQDEAATSLAGVWTGESEALKRFGIVMTDVNLQEYARQQGITKTLQSMTQAEKVQLRYNFVLEQTRLAQGDFAKTSDSWANQTRILSERWKQFMGIIGTQLIQVLAPVLKFLNFIIQKMIDMANLMVEISKAFGMNMAPVSAAAGAQTDVAAATNDNADAQENLAKSTKKANKENDRSLDGYDMINKVKDDSSDESGGGVGSGGAGGVVKTDVPKADKTDDTALNPQVEKIVNFIKNTFGKLSEWFTTQFLPVVIQIWNELYGAIKPVIEEIGALILWLVETYWTGILVPQFQFFGKVIGDVSNILVDFWYKYGKPIFAEIAIAWSNVAEILKSVWNSILSPIFENLLKILNRVWDNGLKPLVDAFAEFFGELVLGAYKIFNEFISPIMKWLIDILGPVFVTVFKSIWNIVEVVINTVIGIVTGFIDVLTGIVKIIVGVFTGDWSKAWEGVKQVFSGVWEIIVAVFSGAWDLIKAIFAGVGAFFVAVWDAIKRAFEPVIAWFGKIFGDAWSGIKGVFANVGDWFGKRWDDIKAIFSGIKTWFETKFTEAWNAIKAVFSGVGKFFGGIWDIIKEKFGKIGSAIGNTIGDAFKKVVNSIIGFAENTINGFIRAINLAIKLINKIPGVEIGLLGELSIPRLAKGAVIPPNKEFMAVLGDQKSGTNLEAPEGLIRKIVREESGSGGPLTIVLQVGSTKFGEVVVNSLNALAKKNGTIQLDLGVI